MNKSDPRFLNTQNHLSKKEKKENKTKRIHDPFLLITLKCLKAVDPILTTKSSGVPVTYSIDLRRTKS